jgi:preprotein translocase subunit SecF
MKNKNIQEDINLIKERNRRVESDKAWETSWTRKIIIAILTYLVIVLFFFVAQLPKPFVNSIVPTAGFVLSTLSLPFFKKWWLNRIYRK